MTFITDVVNVVKQYYDELGVLGWGRGNGFDL